MSQKSELIPKRDLYVYDLQKPLLDSLEVVYFSSGESFTPQLTMETLAKHDEQTTVSGRRQCTSCLIELEELSEQDIRTHYKSDLHRYNVKQRALNQPPLGETEFEKVAETLEDSISGSDSSGNEDVSEVTKATSSLSIVPEEEESFSFTNTRSPFIIFSSSLLPETKCFGVYKSLFSTKELEASPEEALRAWNAKESRLDEMSAVFMIGGGHFAGAIISHKPRNTKGNTGTVEQLLEHSVDFVEHKTFHRYTTRRKQGGSQSASDNARGKAKSAGSTLRRYNEEALQKEVRDLLGSWKGYLAQCSTIFIRANGRSNRSVLIGYDGSPIKGGDPRVRSFPFTTKRATTSELKRAWINLAYMEVLDLPKSDEKQKQRLQKEREILRKSTQTAKKTTATEQTEDEKHTAEIVGLIKKSRAPALIAYLRKHKIPTDFQLQPQALYVNTPTMLHYASASGSAHIIRTLVNNLKADVTAKNVTGRTAWDVAMNKATKQVFQVLRHDLGESHCDWTAAGVDEPLSKDEVERMNTKAKEKDEQEKQELIKRELEKQAQEKDETRITKFGPPKVLLSAPSQSQINMSSLTPEQRMKVMREQRARAAEARMKRS